MEKFVSAVRKVSDRYELEGSGVFFGDYNIKYWLEEGFKSKADVCSLVGLNETNNWRLAIKVGDMDETTLREINYQIAGLCYTLFGEYSLSKGTASNGKKLTRALIEEAKKDQDFPFGRWTYPCQELNIRKIEDIGPRVGESLKKGVWVVVSGNPIDFLTAGASKSFDSCYQPRPYNTHHTSYFNATNSLWYSAPGTLVVYTTNVPPKAFEEPNKQGRVWVHVNFGCDDGSPYLLYGRVFGTISEQAGKMAREAILKPMRLLYGVEEERKWRKDSELGQTARYGYDHPGYTGDREYFVCYHMVNQQPEQVFWDAGSAICFSCGQETSHPLGAVCSDCSETRWQCEDCGSWVTQDYMRNLNGVDLCEDCFDSVASRCPACGSYEFTENMVEGPDEEYICQHCHDTLVRSCDLCDTTLWRNQRRRLSPRHIVNINEWMYVCPNCFDTLNLTECTWCGNEIVTSGMDNIGEAQQDDGGNWYCSDDCINEVLFNNAYNSISTSDVEEAMVEKCEVAA